MSRPHPDTWRRLGSGLAALLLALPALANTNPDDTNALPVEIVADRAEMDERSGIATYRGDVRVTRGAMTLEADTVHIHSRDRRPREFEAHGEPARLQSPHPETGEMRTATALRIDYLLDEERVILTGQARVVAGREEARGQRISLDLDTDVIEAERGDGEDERVRITIQPRAEE